MVVSQQVDFYLLGDVNQSGKFAYACRIAQKAFKQGLKVFMQTDNNENSQTLDAMLWTFSQGSFVPHAMVSNGSENWENYPVQLGQNFLTDESPDLLISLTTDPPDSHNQFKRVADLITDDPADKQSGRNRFRFYRERGVEPKTHRVG